MYLRVFPHVVFFSCVLQPDVLKTLSRRFSYLTIYYLFIVKKLGEEHTPGSPCIRNVLHSLFPPCFSTQSRIKVKYHIRHNPDNIIGKNRFIASNILSHFPKEGATWITLHNVTVCILICPSQYIRRTITCTVQQQPTVHMIHHTSISPIGHWTAVGS